MENYKDIDNSISNILNVRNEHLKLLFNHSVFLSNKFSFLFRIKIFKDEHSESGCQTIFIQNNDDCKYIVKELEVENSEVLLDKLNNFANDKNYPFYLKICFRNRTQDEPTSLNHF